MDCQQIKKKMKIILYKNLFKNKLKFIKRMTSLTSTFNFKPFFSRMTVDMKETENEIIINAEIPNIDKSNLDVEINNNVLTISAERKEETSNSTTKSHISEISYGKILRSIILPTKVDKDKIKAQYVNGVLKIALPKVI